MNEHVRFGLVGAGGIARAYQDVFEGLDEARIVAIAEPNPTAAGCAAERLGCPAFPDHREMVGSVDLDAALVCTPPASHVDIAGDFVERGIAVLVEKPFAIRPDRARELIERAGAAGVTVTMASKFRYVDDVIRAKKILDSGILGETILFENVFASRVQMAGRWNADPAVSGGGVLIDNGTHSVDVARYFLGPIAEVSAVEGKRVQGLAVEDTAQMFLRTADGAMGTVDLSWSVDKAVDAYIGVYGSEGTVEIGWKTARYRQASSPDWLVFGSGYDKVAAMRAQVVNFCGALGHREPLLITSTDAIASVDVIAAAYRSLGHDHWVPVHEPVVRPIGGEPADSHVA